MNPEQPPRATKTQKLTSAKETSSREKENVSVVRWQRLGLSARLALPALTLACRKSMLRLRPSQRLRVRFEQQGH